MTLTTFASGSGGNCLLLSMGGTHVLLDAGISYRRIRQNLKLSGLSPEQLSGVFITHAHSDHISGLGTFVKSCAVPLYAPARVARDVARAYPAAEERLRIIPVGETFSLGEIQVLAFPTSHDTAESVGYRLSGDSVFALATDTGCVTEQILSGLAGAEAALIEANHDLNMLRQGPYPYHLKQRILSDRGHLSNDTCAGLAVMLAERGTKYLVLGHLSRENNRPELALRTVQRAVAGLPVQVFVAGAEERFTLTTEERLCAV